MMLLVLLSSIGVISAIMLVFCLLFVDEMPRRRERGDK
jgi:hypothetical protein